ncbi:hypothetical protein ACFL3V_00655 [Nanoarchaeota archaeon]
MPDELTECPKCGNPKHHEVVKIEINNKYSELFRCRACGFTEYSFPEYDESSEEELVEKMGDAFREFLQKKGKE